MLTRPTITRLLPLGLAAAALLVLGCTARPSNPPSALNALQEGNLRFVEEESEHPRLDKDRLLETAREGQEPFATVIACSDSRVPVELLFDQGVGDLFVIRVAGNVSDVDEIGSIEYGVDHLGTPLLVVLGHEQCGAVTAVVTGAELHGSIPALVDNIAPAVEKARIRNPYVHGRELVAKSVRENVFQSIEDLLAGSPATLARVKNRRLQVVGAVYSLATGEVEWLGEHPDLNNLIAKASEANQTNAAH